MDDILISEILEQPVVVRQLISEELPNIQKITKALKDKFKYIVAARVLLIMQRDMPNMCLAL